MKPPVQVQIGGHRYSLRSDADDSVVREMAAHVDGHFRDVQKTTRVADTQALAVLTALRITEELFKERRAAKELKRQVREKGKALLQMLERVGRE
jgi:cell division protein ZapA (FtsZ GTPase activity inhibitor)